MKFQSIAPTLDIPPELGVTVSIVFGYMEYDKESHTVNCAFDCSPNKTNSTSNIFFIVKCLYYSHRLSGFLKSVTLASYYPPINRLMSQKSYRKYRGTVLLHYKPPGHPYAKRKYLTPPGSFYTSIINFSSYLLRH